MPITTAAADATRVASALRVSIGLVHRRLRQRRVPSDLAMPESAALARLDRDGPATAAELARMERISPQSMGTTLSALEARGLIERAPDPADGRRVILSPSSRGRRLLHDRRRARTEQLARALQETFDGDELAVLQRAAGLLERLGEAL